MKLRNILAIGVAATGFTLAAPAATIDASTPGSVQGPLYGAYFQGLDPNATGTGRIEPFVRIQFNDKDPDVSGTEQGMNTDVNNYLFNKNGPWTHDLPIAWLGTTTIPGRPGNFYEFFLDANQVGNGKISLTDLRIFTSSTALTTKAQLDALTDPSNPGYAPVYKLDRDVNNEVMVTGNSGSGSGDLAVFIPQSLIGTDGYLYLFSEFGGAVSEGTQYLANDGFEEWRALYGPQAPPPPVPDAASTVALLGSALSGLALLRRRLL